ncbi:uncharacterized protein LOC123865534 isoform X2 [Maniola jurtina]|uniref:uncharacterized protein LOC123865534 isoform X2 n=1 Tax=Maniola jurtina TaxID=191418 RepID=UPI001E68AD07|nr:uncharacterized protein LOC123865534 isoform X2 [Maniola jurtina]
MNFEVARQSSAWAHVALCADLTWVSEPPDEFIVANQRLWAQHYRVSQVLQDSSIESSQCIQNHCDHTGNQIVQNQENNSCSSRRSVKDVIPESRLAQFYGNFYYDDIRENCYTCTNEKANLRGYNSHGCDNTDLTECWMLPEVEYWFRKLVDDSSDRSVVPRRRRQYKILPDDDSERWDPSEARTVEEATLEARVRSTRSLWNQPPSQRPARVPSPPPASRKMRARRRQPKRLTLAPPPPAYCLEAPTQLFCDPTCKFQFETPRQQLTEYQRAMGRLSASVQAVMRANAYRCTPYRGTNVSRYAPTSPRPLRYPDRRYGVWWPRDNLTPRLENRFNITQIQKNATNSQKTEKITAKIETGIKKEEPENLSKDEQLTKEPEVQQEATSESLSQQKDKVVADNHLPSTSAAAIEDARKKRLYSTVLSTCPPPPVNLNAVGCLRLSQKLPPGLIKLNRKLVLSSRVKPNVDNKFEELEKEALEQYKASDESIDTKFRELEEEAVDQYSTSNSNTSCSSGNSGEKKTAECLPNSETAKAPSAKFHTDKSVDSSPNFPDLNAKRDTNSVTNLKNFHTPPRGEKKEYSHRSGKCMRSKKKEPQRPASDTDYEARESNTKGSRGAMRWTLHVMPPKKRHLTACVDFSSDEESEEVSVSIKDAGPCIKNRATGKVKMSAHGGGDLHPIMRKT